MRPLRRATSPSRPSCAEEVASHAWLKRGLPPAPVLLAPQDTLQPPSPSPHGCCTQTVGRAADEESERCAVPPWTGASLMPTYPGPSRRALPPSSEAFLYLGCAAVQFLFSLIEVNCGCCARQEAGCPSFHALCMFERTVANARDGDLPNRRLAGWLSRSLPGRVHGTKRCRGKAAWLAQYRVPVLLPLIAPPR